MAKKAKSPTGEIERLLDERRQVEQWLERLDTATDKTPHQVRAKVRSDYQERLDAIFGQLQGFRDELTEALDQQKRRRDDLVKQEAEASETLAEAELRHGVGEFDKDKWSELRGEILQSVDSVREDLKAVEEEIAGLEEAVASVAEPSAGAQVPDQEEAPAEVSGVEVVEAETEAEPAAADVGEASESEPAETDDFDELAFLKSVTDHESPVPRPSGSHRIGGSVSRPKISPRRWMSSSPGTRTRTDPRGRVWRWGPRV